MKRLKRTRKFLKGKKTYALAAAGTVVGGLNMVGVIDPIVATKVLGLLGALAAASIRSGVESRGQ